jgi:hypothetical protein
MKPDTVVKLLFILEKTIAVLVNRHLKRVKSKERQEVLAKSVLAFRTERNQELRDASLDAIQKTFESR